MKNNLNEIWGEIITLGIATKEELQLVTDINGYNETALNDVIYARTGYNDIEQVRELI